MDYLVTEPDLENSPNSEQKSLIDRLDALEQSMSRVVEAVNCTGLQVQGLVDNTTALFTAFAELQSNGGMIRAMGKLMGGRT